MKPVVPALLLLPTLLIVTSLGGCASDDEMGGPEDCSATDSNTPGSTCIDPERFDFEPEDSVLDEILQDEGVEFEAPERGFQIETEGIKLGPTDDDEYCEAFQVPALDAGDEGEDFCISRVEVAMSPGFHHHFVSYAPLGSVSEGLMEVGERVRCVGGAHVVYGTDILPIPLPQGKYVQTIFPEGVGIPLTPGQKLSVNYHYLNVSPDDDIIASMRLNFHAGDCADLKTMGQFGFYNQDIEIPPGGSYSTEMTATFSQDVYVLDLFRHTHRLGREVPVSFYKGERDGMLVFTSTDYELDPHHHFEQPVLMEKGTGFKFVCNYDNPTDAFVRFGPTADDEMCMLLGNWWVADDSEPKVQHRYKFTQ